MLDIFESLCTVASAASTLLAHHHRNENIVTTDKPNVTIENDRVVVDIPDGLESFADGVDNENEQRAAFLFVALCHVAEEYTRLIAEHDAEPQPTDMMCTLAGLKENMELDLGFVDRALPGD